MTTNNLIIIVKDSENKLIKDAKVNINPGNLTGKTDANGQVLFLLPKEKKIDVEVNLNGKTNKTTYYITGNSDQRLEINFAYYQKLQETKALLKKEKNQNGNLIQNFSFILGVLIIILIIWYVFKKNKKINFRKLKISFLKLIKFGRIN